MSEPSGGGGGGGGGDAVNDGATERGASPAPGRRSARPLDPRWKRSSAAALPFESTTTRVDGDPSSSFAASTAAARCARRRRRRATVPTAATAARGAERSIVLEETANEP